MAKMVIEKGAFASRTEVMEDVRDTGYWPTTYVSTKSPELPLHYHKHDNLGYVMSGRTYLLDENEERVEIGPGDKLVIPKGAWHAEGEVKEQVVYIVTFRDPIPFLEGIFPHEPKGPFPQM